jgi:DNA (cytosine-5)-methyltransferase 1
VKGKGKLIFAADLFCGAGGTSSGLVEAIGALGYDLDLLAVNHWSVAIDTHSTNHAQARHMCQSLDTIDPCKAVPSGRLHLLVASPECTHHSNARGGKPMSDQSRASAWLILNWLEKLYVENVLIENVKEFRDWGALGANGRPLKSRRGELYQQFLQNLRSLGYRVEDRVLNAADYGDATTRERLFVMARRGNKSISWPEPTHTKPEKLESATKQPGLFGASRLQPWRPAREIIDWEIEGQSIFERKRPLSPNTMRRIYAGLRKFCGLDFIVSPRGTDSPPEQRVYSTDRPLITVPGESRGIGVARPFIVGAGGPSGQGSPRSTDEPMRTVLPRDHQALCEPFILPRQGYYQHWEQPPRSIDDPIPTITSNGCAHLVQPFVVVLRNNQDARSVEQPVPTICTSGAHLAICEAYAVHCNHGVDKHDDRRCINLDKPLPTINGNFGLGVCQPYLVQHFGEREGQEPRTRPVEAPLWTVTCQGRIGLVEPFLVKYHGDHAGRTDGENRIRSLHDPLSTLDTSNRFALVSPYFVKYYEGSDACSVEAPLPSITANYEHLGLAQPFIVKFYGTANTQSVNEPLSTVTAKDRFGLVEMEIVGKLDIRFRMLQPHELAAAMSFPKSYHFTGTREQKVKQIGNAVPVQLAKALCGSLLGVQMKKERVA